MDKTFSTVGKITLVLLVVAILGGGGFYIGNQFSKQRASIDEVSTETPDETLLLESMSDESPSIAQVNTVAGGLGPESGLSFGAYTVAAPLDWTATNKKDVTVPMDTTTIARNGYTITIYQAATGGAMCLYPLDPPFDGPHTTYDIFSQITTTDGVELRRSGTDGSLAYTVCSKSPEGSYQAPTSYGHITYTIPADFDKEVLGEMDVILTSLKLQK